MVLMELNENEGWLISGWKLTYRVGWKHICKAMASVYDYYEQCDILTDEVIAVSLKEEILQLEEAASLTLRGMSKILGVPVLITFFNQTNTAEVYVAKASDEFGTADYRKFNLSLGQYMDSIELAMYRD